MSALIRAMGESATLKNLGDNLDELGDSEKQELAREDAVARLPRTEAWRLPLSKG